MRECGHDTHPVKSVSKADLKRSCAFRRSTASTPYRSSATTVMQMNRCCSGGSRARDTDGFGLFAKSGHDVRIEQLHSNQVAATQDRELRDEIVAADLPAAPSSHPRSHLAPSSGTLSRAK